MKQQIQSTKYTKVFVLSIVCCLLSVVCSAQLNFAFQEGTFLIKGKVVDIQTKTPLSFVNIRINGTGKGLTCDNEGNFTCYVYKSDTLKFSSTGYLSKVIHVHDLDSTQYYILKIQLMHDFIKLKDVTIYPFKNKDEFIDAFMDAKGVNKISIAGIAAPRYGTVSPKAKFSNPISLLYEHMKHRRAANRDFRP